MELQLLRLRKESGFASRKDFSDALGIPERRIKSWEAGERMMSLEQACVIADLLDCSLDELVGRTDYVGSFSDNRQRSMNRDYELLSDSGKDAAANSVRGIRLGEGRNEPDTPTGVSEKIA